MLSNDVMEDHGEETDDSANEDRHNVLDVHMYNLPQFEAQNQGGIGYRIPEHKQQDGKGQYPQEEIDRFAQGMGGQTLIEIEHQQRVDRYRHPEIDRYQHQLMGQPYQPFKQYMDQPIERNYYSSIATSTRRETRDERSYEHDSLVSRESITSKYMVKVTGLTRTNEELLDLYFSNERRSGAVAEKIEFNQRLESLILTYSSLEDMETVLCKEHTVGGYKLILQHVNHQTTTNTPTTTVVKISGIKHINRDSLTYYVENKKRFGAEIMLLNFDKEDAFVTLASKEDMETVLCKEHTVGGYKLILQHVNHQTTTNTPTTTVVKISGIKHINRDSLTYYVENKKRFGAEIMLLNFDEEDAFVTLASKEDMEAVLCKEHTVGGYKLILQHVNHQTTTNTPTTTVVKISGIKHINRDSLTYYVENKKRFGAEIVSLNFDEEDAFVTLASKEDMETVLCKEHTVGGYKLILQHVNHQTTTNTPTTTVVKMFGIKHINRDSLTYYVENKKRFGAEIVSLNFDEEDAFVTLASKEDMETVLCKEHTVGGYKLILQHVNHQTTTNTPTTTVVKISGIKHINRDSLTYYVENKKRFGAEIMLLNFDEEDAFVTLASKEDMETVLCKEHTVGGYKLILQHVNHQTTTNTPTTTVVKMFGIKHINRDSLTYYVENKKRFGAEIVSLNFDEEDAFVTLASKEDMEAVLCKEHTVGGYKLILQHVNHQTTTNTPTTTVVKISGIKHINRDSLTYYVENKKRFGAEIVSLNFDEEDAFVTLASKEDAETVRERNHKVSGEELEISIYTPPPVLTDRFLITNIDNNTSTDTLVNFVEGNLNCDVLKIEFHTNKNKAVVYCKEEEYEEAFERSIVLKRKQLSGRNLEIRAVNESKIARISGDLTNLNSELLKLYFENNRRSHGGCVDKVELFKDSDYALVYFENYTDLKNVCKKEKHELSNQSLDAAVYYQFMYGVIHTEDANTTDNKTLELNDIEQKKLEYIHQNLEVYSEFEQQMQSVCCKIDWNKEEKKVSIKSTEKKETSGKRQTEHCVEHVKNYLNNLFFQECSLPTEIVSMVLEKMNNKDERRVSLSGEESSIIVIGSDPGLCRQIVSTINEIETGIKEQMEKDKKDITEIASFNYSYDIIHTFGIFENVMEAFHITVYQHTNSKNIELKGRYADVERAKLKIGQMLDDLKQTILNMHPCKIDFILGREFKDYVVKKYFNSKTDMASWERTNENTSVKIVTKDSEELKTIAELFESIVYEEIQIDEVGDTEKWKILQSGIESKFQNLAIVKVGNPNHISITCLAPNKAEILEFVDCFVAENISCSDSLTVKDEYDNFIVKYRFLDLQSWCRDIQVSIRFDQFSNSINIKGSRRGIQQTKDKLENMRGDVYCREDLIQEPTNRKFLKSEKGLEALEMIQTTRSCIITAQSEETKDILQDIELATFKFTNTSVKVVLGDITDLSVDVIVNACNGDLSHSAGLAKAIVQKGGSSIQEECKEYFKKNGKLYPGECMVSNSGTLPCKKVIHAVGPKWIGGNQNEAKILREVILKILKHVKKSGYKTVAIPAISCGTYGYPVLKATNVIVDGIVDHLKNMSNSPITAIYLVDLQQETTKSFISSLKEKEGYFQQQIPTKTQNVETEGDVKLNAAAAVKQPILWPTLHFGEIARVSADVIVNSTSEALNLRDGAVSGSILKTGGDVLQKECNTNYPDGIKPGDIAVTNGGNLKCKKVFHTCLDQYRKGHESSLEKLIEKCLKQAESMGHKSIAFPALGTGNLKYPADIAARLFFDTVSKYGKKRGKIDVTIVLYSGDATTVKAFEEAEKQSRPQSHGQPDVKQKIYSNQKTETPILHQSAVDEMKKGVNIGVFNVKVTESNIMETKTHMIIVEYRKVLKQKDQKNSSDGIQIESLKETDLHIKYIIYVDHERYKRNFKKAITKCLEIADGKGFKSMAFQIPGDDKSNLEIEKIAISFYEVTKKSKKWKKLRNIDIFINDQSTINPFCKLLKKLTLPKQSFKDVISRLLRTNDKTDGAMQTKNKDNEETEDDDEVDADWPVVRDDLVNEEITLYYYSDNREEISKAMEELDYKYLREIHQSEISFTGLSLTRKEMSSIYKLSEEHCVQVKFDPHLYRIIVRGLNTDTNIVHGGIQRILREFEVSNLLKVVIQWSWLEKGKKNNFTPTTNKNIEDSFQSKQDTMDVELHRTMMTIRFDEMIMVAENNDEYSVLRQDKVKESTIQLPLNWNLTDGTNLNVVTLDESCDEYQEVVKNFQATLGTTTADIVKIERIENRSVYQQYMAKKKQMELEMPGKNVEQPVLWHGTDKDAVSSINNYGFNRSYCGKNATMYGHGVYFAVNSSYSTRYARRNTEGGRQMYQCRVLVGESTQGKQEYRVPPQKPDGHVYESLVNDINDPKMFIIFHDTQAYPNYLITF